jgi:hypothetical protein
MKRVMWEGVALQPGKNTIEASAMNGKTIVRDRCIWDLK